MTQPDRYCEYNITFGDGYGFKVGADGDITYSWDNDNTVYEIKDSSGARILSYDWMANAKGYWRMQSTIAYDDASQAPILDLYQTSDGECFMRYIHGNRADVGSEQYNDFLSGVPNNDTGHIFVLSVDHVATALSFNDSDTRILIAKQTGGGTTLVADAAARLEVRGTLDEIQALVKAHSTQSNAILDVQNSGGTSLFTVGDTVTTLGQNLAVASYTLTEVGEIYGDQDSFINTKNADNATVTFRARDNGNTVVTVGGLIGGADPYYALGGAQELKVYKIGRAHV